VPEKAFDPKLILGDALIKLNVKAVKPNIARAHKSFDALRGGCVDSVFAHEKITQEVFGNRDLTKEVVSRLKSAYGWFIDCASKRNVGKGLFCMGFHDKAKLLHTLAMDPDVVRADDWFQPYGHGVQDEIAEDFRALYAPYRKRDSAFLEFIRDLIFEQMHTFSSIDTRPVALRCLGELDRNFFAHFCAVADHTHASPIHTGLPQRSISVDGQAHPEGTRMVRVAGERVAAETVSLCRTLLALDREGLLRFECERGLSKRSIRLFDCEQTLQGRGRALDEVHAICSTRRICLGFQLCTTAAIEIDKLRHTFMTPVNETARCDVTLYVRDAHLLKSKQMAHLFWRVAGRAAFRAVVLSTRFEYDTAYASPFAVFLNVIAETVVSSPAVAYPDVLAGTSFVADLSMESLAAFSGVCIVPTAQDAARATDEERLSDGSNVFAVSPPLFGRVGGNSSARRISVSLPIDGREIQVALYEPHKNVYASAITAARGVLVPASALTFQRKIVPCCNTKATVFVPVSFSRKRQNDLVNAAKAFFRVVTVVAVDAYSMPTVDPVNVRRVVNALRSSVMN
jgi:hypothetical protein